MSNIDFDFEFQMDSPLGEYETPPITNETKKKIVYLRSVAKSIEDRMVTDIVSLNGKKYRIDYATKLNNQQLAAAITVEGPVLVIAGAGSGKTRTLVHRLAYMVENDIDPSQIVVLTFTRRAADEMIRKASDLLGGEECEKVVGGTFHSFASFLLRKYSKYLGIKSNFTIIDTTDSSDILDYIKKEFRYDVIPNFPKKKSLQAIISKSYNDCVPLEQFIDSHDALIPFKKGLMRIHDRYLKYKEENNAMDFDDLLVKLEFYLRSNVAFLAAVQNIYKYIMVDEYQDTNITQSKIIDIIASKHKNIMVVGDDSQSIYGFRGANMENILEFPVTYSNCKVIKIEQNYRSTQGILNLANRIVDKCLIGYKKKLTSVKEIGIKPEVRQFGNQAEEASFIVREINKLTKSGISLDDIAVLYRSGFHSYFLQRELLAYGIPYVVYGGVKFSERSHVRDIIAYLRITNNHLDAISWNRALTLLPGIGKVSASKIVSHVHSNLGKIEFNEVKKASYTRDLNNLARAINDASNPNFTVSDKIRSLMSYYEPLLKTTKKYEEDSKSRVVDINFMIKLAERFKYDIDDFLSSFTLEPPNKKKQDNEITDEDNGSLVLSTVHSAKGLEWDATFVIHMVDGLFPSKHSLNRVEGLEEERRLFYVACTRAENRLYLTTPLQVSGYGDKDTKKSLPSRFVEELVR